MPPAYGASDAGFQIKTQQELLAEEIADLLRTIRNDLDPSPSVPLGQQIGIDSQNNADLWELLQVGYNATNRDAATGAALDAIGAITGCRRLPASFSSVECSCAFSTAGTYPAGSLTGFVSGLSAQQATNSFAVVVPATNPLNGLPVSATNPYVTGSSYAGATLFAAPVTGPNFGQALVGANALLPNTMGAFSGQTPVSGWATLVDIATPTIGTAIEGDPAYRARQVQDLAAQGACNLPAIAVDVVDALLDAPAPVTGATCVTYENTSDYFDANGLPPHSYQVVVFDGINPNTQQNNPLIAQQIWNNKPAGLRPYGSTQFTVLDRQGQQRTVSFTRPTELQVFMVVNVAIASTATPAQVQALVAEAVVTASQGQPFTAYGQTVQSSQATTLLPGVDVIPEAFQGVAQAQAGVVRVTSVLVGLLPNPTLGAVLEIPRGSIAVLQTPVVNCVVFVP